MYNLLLILRVFTLAVFIVSNAIICSVGAWSLSIAETMSYSSSIMQLAGYLIFVGAFSLVFVFPLLFVEILRRNPRTTTVWFELSWIGVFWLLEFVGAVALSAQFPSRMCIAIDSAGDAACSSISVLLGFSWVCTIILLVYFAVLLGSALVHHREDPQVWRASVNIFPWFDMKHCLPSPKAASSMFIAQKRKVSIVAPKPRRAAPAALFSYRGGMSSEYEIEHFQEPDHRESLPVPPIPAQAPYQPHRLFSQEAPAQSTVPAASFYPQYLQTPESSIKPPAATAPPPPPPLKPAGDWPRRDADTTQRQKSGRQIRYQPITRPTTSTISSDDNAPAQAVVVPTPTLPQPTVTPTPPSTQGSRTPPTPRSQRTRPPPLDLSAVRAYDSARARR